jgi:ribosomal protein L37AE/L43A
MNQKCPVCKSENTIPIVYGMPSPQLNEGIQKRGDLKPGGAYVEVKNWNCRDCGLDFEGSCELSNLRIATILNEIKSNLGVD